MENLKITFELDGTGIVLYPNYPIILDALMAWVVAGRDKKLKPVTRNGSPYEIMLPLKKWKKGGVWGWHASALFIEGNSIETIGYWRKRFRQTRYAGLGKQQANIKQGAYRDYNTPLPVTLCNALSAYVVGKRAQIYNILSEIRYIGHKRNMGYGRVLSVSIERTDHDYSIMKNGQAQRFVPDPHGRKFIRPRPPYWNNKDKVKCCNVGDMLEI